MEPPPRVDELILSGADVSVLNHTTLSLWHFRQLALELLPPAAAASAEPEEDQELPSPETPVEPPPSRGIELGEGMSVAAVLFEQPTDASRPEKSGLGDAEPTGDNNNRTESAVLHLQGVTTHIQGQLTPDTRVAAVFRRYRCVLCLDASPSILSIDPSAGRLFLDLLYESVELFIWSMLRPMEVGGVSFTPEIHVSVLVQGALVESLCVLMQGYIVTPSNAAGFLQLIKERFQLIENDWASQAQERGQWGYLGNATPASLDWILQNAVFALNSLPTDCTPMMVLVTDGVVDVRDAYSYDNLLMQLVRHDIQCHFLRIGGGGEDELNATFGFVPDTHLLRFVAEYTGGTVFDYVAIHEACYGTTSACSNVVKKMTGLQDACFLRKSSVHANSAPVVKLNEMDSTSFDGRTLLPLRPYRMWREKVHEYRIFADVERIVEARLREGFSINKVYVKTYQQPLEVDGTGLDSPRSGDAAVDPLSGRSNEVTKILIVFLLQWKQNVWLEYVVSTTTENSATLAASGTAPHTVRRPSGQGLKGPGSSSSARKPSTIFSKDQTSVWSEWYVKMNILAYADFLRAFEDTMQRPSAGGDRHATARGPGGDVSMASPVFVHDFIRNVQDVDRVLLHLMTATASISENSDSVANQFSFGTSANSASASVIPKITSSHPVFNIIGELSTVLWHRWFFVERFEILCVVKSDACTDLFYRNEMHGVVERGSAGSHSRGPGNPSPGVIQNHGANVYGTNNGNIYIGVESLAEPLIAILVKWSSQKLSQDLFLKFLRPTAMDKSHAPPRAKASPSLATASGGIAQRRRQRSHNSNVGEDTSPVEDNSESRAALCFVRLEFKNKTLCAVHVAFFATKASTRRQVLNELKSTIFAGINEVAVTPSPAKLLSSSLTETPIILCHRMLSRLLVTHDTLLLHGIDQEPGPFDYYVASPTLEAEKNAGAIPPSTTCCGGSELQLHRVFGAYVWHSSWKWEVSNLTALLDVMRRLHDARISCGFWVLDWKMEEGDDGQGAHVESVIFCREILMEDEKGHTKTALVQYALRRVSDTCLMTSFWMEPQHGVVKSRLSEEVDHNDRFHWSLKQAIGHSTPFENYENRGVHRNSTPRGISGRASTSSMSSLEDEQKSMEQEDVSIDWSGDTTYLGESELLHLIRGYLFKSDRHFLSCMYTFDCIINLRENIELLNQLSKDVDDVVGSNWSIDRQLAAENGMILPPFSTARLLATSNRSTEHFLMYLQNGKASASGVGESRVVGIPPSVSTANENLYSMLELTLRGLSDCEVSWADYNGDTVAGVGMSTSNDPEDDRFFREGMDGQLPLWLKQHLALTFKDRVPHHALSKGKCFAKLVSGDCVVLAFFPSLDTLQVQHKTTAKGALFKGNDGNVDKLAFDDRLSMPRKAPGKEEDHKTPSQQFSVRAAEEDGTKSRVVRMSVSADDIVLYQERRRSFREGYKSWRMGHYQGSRDDKQSYGRDFQKLRLPSTPEDHEFCEEISRRAAYGCDFHLLIESSDGILGSGFFQVAFYECSLSRLSTDLHDSSKQMPDRVDLPHTILKQLFFSKRRDTPREDRPSIPLDRGHWKKSPARSPSDSTGSSHSRVSSDSILASRRFRKKHSDLLQALSSCIEVPVDVDITLLYRMMETAASHKIPPLSPAAAAVVSAGIGADILKDKLTKSFETILSSVFVPIAGTKYYYFTGNENTIYEDLSATEYDLHILMEDSDDDDGEALVDNQKKEETQLAGSGATGEEKSRHSVDEGDNAALRRRLEGTTHVSSDAREDAGEKRPFRRRRGSLGRELPPPVVTSTEDSSGSEQHHANVEEDAEFNKEVAVATSSFSVPFFFKFECRVLNGSRDTRSNSADAHASGEIPDSELLRRSSSTAAYEDMRKDMVAQAQLTSPSSRQEEFNAFLESLKTSQGSCKQSNATDVTQIAESYSNTPLGRIALRLITLTLPNERAFDGGRVPSPMPFEMDNGNSRTNKANTLPSMRTYNFSTLHLFQRQVLSRVRNDIKEWCSVEILSVLKSANEITPAIGSLVQRLFDDLPTDAVTKAKYPLEFVARGHETPVNPLDLFKREFEKGDLLNVHRCNNVYFVVENGKSADMPVDVAGNPGNFEIPFWAYFELGSDHISLRLHHPYCLEAPSNAFNRLEVLTRLQLGVRAVCRRVNQFLLLLQLHETRTCNGLLLPPNGNLPSSPRSPKRRAGSQGVLDSMSGKDGMKQAGFFWPGQFECDIRYSAFFRLHERLAPNFALNMLCTSALEQFQVHNRRHIFVYRDRDGHVFYMKISIFYDTTLSPAAGSGEPAEERQERSGLARSSTGGSSGGGTTGSTTATTPAGVPGIRLEVFGVSEAGEEVTHELCRLLERKLDEATQVVLMKLLARNTKFQLSPTDLTFLCPPAADPANMVDYILPEEVSDCCTLLHYLSQTLKLAPYIRPVISGGSLPSRNSRDPASSSARVARRGSLASAGSTISLSSEEVPKTVVQDVNEEPELEGGNAVSTEDSTRTHPTCFGHYQKTLSRFQEEKSSTVFDAAMRSPIFFSRGKGLETGSGASAEVDSAGTSVSVSPEVVAQASYVLNLNPDLRLSQGFMSRVGKGLALMRVDLIRTSLHKTETDDEGKKKDVGSENTKRVKRMHDIPGLAGLYSNTATNGDSSANMLVARCQVWIRGSIHTTELSNVVEAFLDEALYDYHIEATIRKFQLNSGRNDAGMSSEETHAEVKDISGTQGKLSSDVDTLVSLFKSACLLPSSSVTNLGVNLSIAPWDLENAVAQIRSFLGCLPHHLRPAVYAKSRTSGSYESVGSRSEGLHVSSHMNEPLPDKYRLVVKHVGDPDGYEGADSSDSDAETTASMSSALHHIEPLMRTDSIHSEISDIDSVSGRMPLTWTATGASSDSNAISQIQTAPSVSSTTSSMVGLTGGLSHQPHLLKGASFSERDVLHYSSSGNSHHHHQKSKSHEHRDVKRSFYYVVDLSTSKGLRLYGYNMSSALVEALATHMARMLTWSMLREKLLRSLLLEKLGLSGAAPVGSMVLQPRSLFLTIGRTERAGKAVGKNPAVLCKDSAVHFIEYRAPVLSVLQSNEWFPRVLDASRLRSIDGIALGVYLREAQTQPALEALDSQYARPRGKSNSNLGASIGPPSIPDLSREVSGPSLSQRSIHSNGDTPSNLLGGQMPGRARSGGIVSSSNVSDSISSSPNKRLSGPSPALPYPGGNRSEVAARMRGGAGAATALMAARARARGGGGLPGRLGGGPGVGVVRGGGNSVASSGDSVAPWDLPLSNTKGPRLHALADEADQKSSTSHDGVHTDPHAEIDSVSANIASGASKSKFSGANRHVRRGSRGTGLSDLGSSSSSSSLSGLALTKPSAHRRGNNDTVSSDPGRIRSSWKKRLECAWGPRFLFPGNTERWAMKITAEQRQHFIELEEEEDQPKKHVTPLPFFCAALEKRWEAFETRSTSHTVGMNLLEKLASLRADEEMEEPVAKDVVAHLVESGHLLLHQRFRAAFVERWIAAEVIGVSDGEKNGIANSRLRALQSCMDLVHLLSYKREFVFDQDECSVAKLYTEHTVLSMGAGAGADVRGIKQQVAANLEPLRLEVASEFYKEYAVHLRTLGFRRLRTLNTSRSLARAFPVDHVIAGTDTEIPGGEGFSEYFYHPERAAAEAGGWKVGPNSSSNDAHPLSIVVLEVKCDNRGVRLTAVLVSLHDLEQQDLRFQNRLAAKTGKRITGVCGSRVYSVASWLRAQLQTQALIYGFTIRYFQQHLLQWINASHDFHGGQNGQGHSVGKHLSEDDALVVTPPMPWKKASTFQNIIKGLQCFLHAFPGPPEEPKSFRAPALTSSSPARNSGSKSAATTTPNDPRASLVSTSAAPGSDGHRPTSRAAARFARRTASKQHQQQQTAHRHLAPAGSDATKSAAPLSLLWRDCVIRVAMVTLQPTSLQSNCSELIMVQILLRYIACHGSRYEMLDLLQFGTPDAVACHSSSGSFFHRPPSTITPSTQSRKVGPLGGYSLVITTQPLTRKPLNKDSVQLLLLKSTPSELGVGNGVLPVERALQEAQLFTREMFRVAAQHYERDLLWSRLLFDDSRGPGADVARTLVLPSDLFRVEVGPQQLEECLRLSICTPLVTLDPRLDELLRVSGVCWQELALRLRDIYADQLREFQFQEEDENSSHLLLLCPDTFDLIIHLTFITPKDQLIPPDQAEVVAGSVSGDENVDSSSQNASINDSRVSSISEQFSEGGFKVGDVRVEICRREEPTNKQFTFAQRRSISEFVNSIVHWQWRSLIYD
ncbi:KICSTOR complex protein szt2 [Phytophthora pseudosyringae]|uniref:KICSTOR complex protein szt2 n=1 Tax=Phytophthora pseudosyringae TaxID=221518 RepID=A0A8T1VB82_9STRA|nr:KICSTOR complex protein szt2 [Phytophthora pseudosyringae]